MSNEMPTDPRNEIARLEHELDDAEGYAQMLRARIVEIRDVLASGNAARALSLCNQTMNEIDNATDVVASSPSEPKPGS